MKCSKCNNEARRHNRYCKDCHNAYQREWRKQHPAATNTRQARAVSRVHIYVERWKFIKPPCEICGSPDRIEGHHENYDYPLVIRWLCQYCHSQVTWGRLTLPPKEPIRLLNPAWGREAGDDRLSPEENLLKMSRYILTREKAWIQAGRVGVFKSYPVPSTYPPHCDVPFSF